MRHVTLKNIFARKLRLLTTSIAIAFGVAFVTGALILGATINQTFTDLFSNIYKNTSAVVQGPLVFSTGDSDVRLPIDASLLNQIKQTPGVTDAKLAYNGNAQLVDTKGKTIGGGGAPTFGDSWGNDPKLNPFQITKGAPPTQDNQIVVDKGTADKSKLHVGDQVQVITSTGPANVVISGIAKFGQVDSPAGASYVLFDDATAAKLLAQPGKVNSIAVTGNGTESQGALVNRLADVLPKNVNVMTGDAIEAQNQAQLKKDIGGVSLFLEIFGGITLFVGAFIINNTFSILLAQRLRETALMRAIGATRGQVLRSMIAEAFALGLLASVIGIALGIGISAALKFVLELFNVHIADGALIIPSSAVITALVAGIGITMVAAVAPSLKSSKVAPMAALRDVAIDNTARSVKRFVVGIVITAIGAALIAVGLITSVNKPYIPTGVGAGLVFIGVAVMGPAIARPASWLIGAPLPLIMGTTGHLARENALRNPRRTSSTAAALMVGVGVVGLLSVVFTSIEVSTAKAIDKAFTGDFLVSARGTSGFPLDLATKLKAKSQLSEVAEERDAQAQLDNKSVVDISAVDFKTFSKVISLPLVAGSLNDIGVDNFGTTDINAKDNNWTIGQKVTVQFEQGAPQTLTLAAIYTEATAGILTYTVPLETFERTGVTQTDSALFVNKAKSVSPTAAREAIESVTNSYPGARIQDETQFKDQIKSQISVVLRFFYGLLGLAVIIALIGIANTLALSVLERTREIGLMRAVGMTRRQVKRMVRYESVIVALLGTILGLLIGLAFGWALVASLNSEGITTLSIPIWTMVAIVVIAGLAGVAAAILPARRAARLNMIRAIASE